MLRLKTGSKISAQEEPRRGASLAEMAVVLGIIGIVSAAIWATMSQVRARAPMDQTVMLASEIADGVRRIYTGHLNAVPPTVIADQIANNLYPPQVVNEAKDDTMNAWNGTIFINFATAPLTGFAIEFTLPEIMSRVNRRETCITMVTRMRGWAVDYAGGYNDTLPAAAMPLGNADEGGPALVFVNTGNWVDVTKEVPSEIFPDDDDDCEGFAFYYRI